MKVRFKKLSDSAVLPSYAKPGDAGLDLTATKVINSGERFITYGTDLAVEIPEGFVGLIFPRSSIRKTDLILSNSVGVIDSGYRGEIQFTFKKKGFESIAYHEGERIGQLVIIPYPQIEVEQAMELSETERGEGGFGSTGV